MKKTKTEKKFDLLRNHYPNIIELFARMQFYRNNPLPTEINNIIENLLLDLKSLNGGLCSANTYLEVIKMNEGIRATVFELIPDSPLQKEEEKRIEMEEKAYGETLSILLKIDIKKFITIKTKAFDSLLLEKNETVNCEIIETSK
ncbi:MAG: hypothetical protein AM1032_000117 [Mycoplasmataceae bacterium]|nr:MAG: hypothetical protein AM1032_000117 [Mycoplasmataceae bacterium]